MALRKGGGGARIGALGGAFLRSRAGGPRLSKRSCGAKRSNVAQRRKGRRAEQSSLAFFVHIDWGGWSRGGGAKRRRSRPKHAPPANNFLVTCSVVSIKRDNQLFVDLLLFLDY